jgi:hypothetical protein
MKTSRILPALAVIAMSIWWGVAPASAQVSAGHASGTSTCTGTVTSPGTLAGTYAGNVTVTGVCFVDAGPATVRGNLMITPGSAVVAAFGTGNSRLSVGGNLLVKNGATLIMGCEPFFFTCLDDPANTLTSTGTVHGNLIGSQALALVVHASTVGNNIVESAGGPGQNCATPASSPSNTPSLELWAALVGSAPYSGFEDMTIGNNVIVNNLATCWLGTNRLHIGNSLTLVNNQLADPDGIEILANHISHNIICQGNSFVWNSSEASFGQPGLFPRTPQPNTVDGKRIGQCVLASPTTPGGPLGPGPF